jgi:hypothetical protein
MLAVVDTDSVADMSYILTVLPEVLQVAKISAAMILPPALALRHRFLPPGTATDIIKAIQIASTSPSFDVFSRQPASAMLPLALRRGRQPRRGFASALMPAMPASR